MNNDRISLTTLASFAALALAACQPSTSPESAETTAAYERVESQGLGIAIAALPDPFTVASNTAEALELHAPGADGDGHARITIGEPREHGVNLVEETKSRRAAFEALPNGQYIGNRELGGPLGTIYTARGTYDSDSGPVEETWAYSLHPVERSRLLTVVYTYPTGESTERIEQLLYLLGEIEGLHGPDEAEAEADEAG